MDAYIYRAALCCEECGRRERNRIIRNELWLAQGSEDSMVWPQGPYPDGGGEADTPQHCDSCRVFLENPLTGDGIEYVREGLDVIAISTPTTKQWREFYADVLAG